MFNKNSVFKIGDEVTLNGIVLYSCNMPYYNSSKIIKIHKVIFQKPPLYKTKKFYFEYTLENGDRFGEEMLEIIKDNKCIKN